MTDHQEYYNSLFKMPIASAALFRNEKGEILLLKPTYKETNNLPGGVVEQEESPYAACAREVEEELGLKITPGALLCVDVLLGKDMVKIPGMKFVFDGGVLTQKQISEIKIQEAEIAGFHFVDVKEVPKYCAQYQIGRILGGVKALKEKRFIYMEDGKELVVL